MKKEIALPLINVNEKPSPENSHEKNANAIISQPIASNKVYPKI